MASSVYIDSEIGLKGHKPGAPGHASATTLVVIGMTVAPVPIQGLVVVVPPDIFTVSSVLLRFPPRVRTGLTFVPLMIVTVLAVVVAMDFMVFVVVATGVESSGPESHWRNHGCHQNKGT
jgi:membrane associated rhomboid family serine protease